MTGRAGVGSISAKVGAGVDWSIDGLFIAGNGMAGSGASGILGLVELFGLVVGPATWVVAGGTRESVKALDVGGANAKRGVESMEFDWRAIGDIEGNSDLVGSMATSGIPVDGYSILEVGSCAVSIKTGEALESMA